MCVYGSGFTSLHFSNTSTHTTVYSHTRSLFLCFCLDSHPLSTLSDPSTLLSAHQMLGWAWLWQSDALWSWSSKAASHLSSLVLASERGEPVLFPLDLSWLESLSSLRGLSQTKNRSTCCEKVRTLFNILNHGMIVFVRTTYPWYSR